MTGIAAQVAGVGGCPWCAKIHQGTRTPPSPGITIVNARLRAIRLSVRVIVAHRLSRHTRAGGAGRPARSSAAGGPKRPPSRWVVALLVVSLLIMARVAWLPMR